MVVLRPTAKLRSLLPPTSAEPGESDTALGDWYVNRIVVSRKPLLVLVSSRGLLPMLLPARDVRSLPDRLPELIGARLRRLGVAEEITAAEARAMLPVVVARATDRSTIGIMVEFARMIPYHLERGDWDETTLPFTEAWLAETPCHATRRFEDVVWPVETAPALLRARWGAGVPVFGR